MTAIVLRQNTIDHLIIIAGLQFISSFDLHLQQWAKE